MNGRICLLIVCLATLGWLVACEESSVLPPTAPSPLPADKVGELTIACLADVTVQSFTGRSALVVYPQPRVDGGLAPVTSGCAPPSGTSLPIGTSTGGCTTSDTLGQTASCSFTITVLPPPQLSATRFLAFGDSMTAGTTSVPLARSGLVNPTLAYPFRLQGQLRQAYATQPIVVINSGLPGESAANAVSRFQGDLAGVAPEVVLIMDGTNDVNSPGKLTRSAAAAQAAAALEAMVLDAQGRGIDPVLATIPPIRPTPGKEAAAQAVVELNNIIRGIAFSRGVPLVDVFAVVSQGSCAASSSVSLPCIGSDGIHPTEEANELIAGAFFGVIVENYDVPVSALSSSLLTDGLVGTEVPVSGAPVGTGGGKR